MRACSVFPFEVGGWARGVRWSLSACALAMASTGVYADAPSHEQITQMARDGYESRLSSFNWDIYFNRYELTGAGNTPQYDGRHFAWNHARLLQGELAMYRGTGDTRHLDVLFDDAERMFAGRSDRLNPPLEDEMRERISPAWISFNTGQGSLARQHAWLGHAGMITHSVAQAIVHVRQDSALQAQYGSRADILIQDTIETMDSFEAEFNLSGEEGWYYDPYFDFYAPHVNGVLPFNLQNTAGRTYIALYEATGEERFRDRAEALALRIQSDLREEGDHYLWRYGVHRAPNSAEDMRHAGMNVNFMIDAYEAGIVFSDDDIHRLANTFRQMYREGEGFATHVGTGETGFTANIDGGGGVDSGSEHAMRWLRLAHYDESLRKDMLPFFEHVWSQVRGREAFPTAGYYVETGRTFERDAEFTDNFDGVQLDRKWIRSSEQLTADTWDRELVDGRLLVHDIHTSDDTGRWLDILRHRRVDVQEDWDLRIRFGWDSSDPDADGVQARHRFFLLFHDEEGEQLGRVGMTNAWTTTTGVRSIALGEDTFSDNAGFLPLSGEAELRVISDGQEIRVWWDDQLLLTHEDAFAFDQLQLQFGHQPGDSHFGTIWVDQVALVPEPHAALQILALAALLGGLPARRLRSARGAASERV